MIQSSAIQPGQLSHQFRGIILGLNPEGADTVKFLQIWIVAQILGKEGKYAILRLASGEVRKVLLTCRATIGTVGNEDYNLISRGKAGRTIDGLVLNLLFEDIL